MYSAAISVDMPLSLKPGLVAFLIVFVADGQIMTLKTFLAKAAFVIARPQTHLFISLQ
jgi:hypothetical protein